MPSSTSQKSPNMQIPVIKFTPFLNPNSSDEERLATALELDRACREVGFFYLSDHGIQESVLSEMLDFTRTFFEKAPEDEKQKIATKKSGEDDGDDIRGYKLRDRKAAFEAVDFLREIDSPGPPYTKGLGRNKWPRTPNSLQALITHYTKRMSTLGVAVMQAFALALKVDEDLFISRVDRAFWQLRLAAYPGIVDASDESKTSGISQHSDFGILTFLLTDEHKGSLQVLAQDGTWISADPIPGAFICNIGDMLSHWTGGVYKSTQHKVVHTSAKTRISIPFFFDPNWDARISPVLPLDRPANDTDGIDYKDVFTGATKTPY